MEEDRTASPHPVDVGTLRLDLLTPPAGFRGLLLARRADLSMLQYHELPRSGLWALDKLRSPVVEYSPGYDPSGHVRQQPGRMWFATSHYDDATGALVHHPDGFLAWADRL